MEKFTHKVGKVELSIIFDKDELRKEIESEKDNFQKAHVRIGEYPDEGTLSEDEYMKNVEDMLILLDQVTAEPKLIEFLEKAQKKKNGTLYKKRICFREGCENSSYISDWHNTWIYNALDITAVSDTELLISYKSITDTPG